MQPYNEEEVLTLIRSGENDLQKKAFGIIVAHYGEKLYWQIRKLVLSHDDANDILQNTFIKAWMNLDLFRGDARLSTWLYKITINECFSFLNRQRSLNSISIDDTDVFLLNRLESDDFFDGDEAQLKLQQAIFRLPEKQRLVFNMRYYDELSYDQISEILGTSVGALKASYHHAAKKIEEFLTQTD